MLPIVYYITGHGYGHAVRSCQVLRALKQACPEAEFHVRTTAPAWIFERLPFSVDYRKRLLDVGIAQKDSLEMDLEQTLQDCLGLRGGMPALIREELDFIARSKIRLVVADVPAAAFEIAARAAVPSVAVTNFSWNWIYRFYGRDFPAFLPVTEEMESFYSKATLCLSLPFSCDLAVFPRRASIPLVTRASGLSKREARERYGLPATSRVVLLSFGGYGLKRAKLDPLSKLDSFYFVTTGNSPFRHGNFLVLPEEQRRYEDLVQAADVVVTKPGYGIVADIIAHKVPVLYTSRGPFPEYDFLVETLKQWATSEFIPQQELFAGNLEPYLERLLTKGPNWPDVPLDGAQVAAQKILGLLGKPLKPLN
jgi:L-arabinokinase